MNIRTALSKNNSNSGQIDRDIKGRIDLPMYQNGYEISQNFFHTIKGDCYFRPGFEYLDEIGRAALYEFKFNQEQSYLLVFRSKYIEFWTYDETGEFVRVLDNDRNEYTLIHPWGTEVFNLSIAQNCDVMYISHINGDYPEYQLKRISANSFTLSVTAFTNSGTQSLSSVSSETGHGYPCTCAFYENRLTRCSSSKYPTYLYGSKGAEYNNITVGTGTNDGYQFDLAEANSRALWLLSGVNSLLVGTAEGILTVNGGSVSKAITPSDIAAKLSCRIPVSRVTPIYVDNYAFFVTANGRQIHMFEYDVLTEQFKTTNLSKANYEITKGKIKKLAYKFDRYGLIFAICGKNLLALCFSNDEAVNAQSEFKTNGEFIDICAVTRPDGEHDLFANIKRNINGTIRYTLEKLSDYVEFSRFEDFISEIPKDLNPKKKEEIKRNDRYAYNRKIAEELRECNFLDCSIKYSGLHNETITLDNDILTADSNIFISSDVGRRIWYKTETGKEYGIIDIIEVISGSRVKVNALLPPVSSTTSKWYLSATVFKGLEHLEGEVVSVVGNGGYIGEFVVQNGEVDISSANTNKVGTAIIGLKYKGILKSTNLGIDVSSQGTQTFYNMKNIYKIGLNLNYSAGGKVGDNLYELEDVQDFSPDGLFDIPPLPVDNYKEINISGDYSKDKHYFIVQDAPLPFHIASVVPFYKHIVKT